MTACPFLLQFYIGEKNCAYEGQNQVQMKQEQNPSWVEQKSPIYKTAHRE